MSNISTIHVHENGFTYIAEIAPDRWDSERITATLWDVGAEGGCVSVGDGACGFSALEDALWDALAERAHEREAAMIADILAGVRESVRLGRLYAGL